MFLLFHRGCLTMYPPSSSSSAKWWITPFLTVTLALVAVACGMASWLSFSAGDEAAYVYETISDHTSTSQQDFEWARSRFNSLSGSSSLGDPYIRGANIKLLLALLYFHCYRLTTTDLDEAVSYRMRLSKQRNLDSNERKAISTLKVLINASDSRESPSKALDANPTARQSLRDELQIWP